VIRDAEPRDEQEPGWDVAEENRHCGDEVLTIDLDDELEGQAEHHEGRRQEKMASEAAGITNGTLPTAH